MPMTYCTGGLPPADLGVDGDLHADATTHIWRLKKHGAWIFLVDHSAMAAEDRRAAEAERARPKPDRDNRFFPRDGGDTQAPFKRAKKYLQPEPMDTCELAQYQKEVLDQMMRPDAANVRLVMRRR